VLGAAFATLFALVHLLEHALRERGFEPTIQDSDLSWARERGRAAALGSKALILVGASRIQLGIDLQVLREGTGMNPVQLAVDGSHFLPVLEGLAQDPSITGSIVVAIDGALLSDVSDSDQALALNRYYFRNRIRPWTWLTSETTESWLGEQMRRRLSSYSDGSQPLDSLLLRVIQRNSTPQYLVTFPDRSRAADYSRVSMPEFYLRRVAAQLGRPLPTGRAMDQAALDAWFAAGLARIAPTSTDRMDLRIAKLRSLAAMVRSRGGNVVFLKMPVSGMIRAIEERGEPRHLVWDRFAAMVDAPTIHYGDVAEMREFHCPDGSHIDRQDREAFTRILARELIVRGVVEKR